jgi:hypothetical protein
LTPVRASQPFRSGPPRVVRHNGAAISRIVLFVAFALVTAAFVMRPIPITSDDPFYIYYFLVDRPLQQGFIAAILDEPLFTFYTNIMGRTFGPITNVRVMILLSLAPHALYAMTLQPRRGWVYFFCYFGFVELAAHMGWVQLRQGMTIGLLLLAIHFLGERRAAIYSAVIGLVHTAMIVAAPTFATPFIKNRKIAYGIVIGMALLLIVFPNVLYPFTYYFGRRESVYLNAGSTVSTLFVFYSVIIMSYVTLFFRDKKNADNLLIYHTMCALFIPMFLIPTYAAFAERFLSIIRWYELFIVVNSRVPRWNLFIIGYIGLNLIYTVYNSIAYANQGGYLDRIQSLFGY